MGNLPWSPERLSRNIETWTRIGADINGGITRLAFSNEYKEAAEMYAEKLKNVGLSVYIDSVGNVIGTLKGKNPHNVIMTGSHLDTVIQGGPLDGSLGTLAALEFLTTLKEQGIELESTLQVVAFAAEEGGPFGGTFGSRTMMGLIDTTAPGLEAKLAEVNLSLGDIHSARIDTDPIRAFVELHIEQGDYLESEKIPVGIVTGIVGITRLQIVIKGESNHSGTTTMANRRDAVEAFSELVGVANRIIRKTKDLVGTFGVVHVHPNMANIIPGKVETVLEMRHMDRGIIESVLTQIKAEAAKIRSADFNFEILVDKGSCQCSDGIISAIESACLKTHTSYKKMVSGAGHDANAIANRIPVGMIFIPSMGGKSHCPDEISDWKDVIQGCDVYFQTLLELDRMYGCGQNNKRARTITS